MARNTDEHPRTLRCYFYNGTRELLKTTAGSNPRTMVLHMLDHLQMDHYGARSAEVIDTTHGTLHAQARIRQQSAMITYKRPSIDWRKERDE